MDFNQIRYFLALSDTLNFTRAAEQCHVSQPALTQAIRRLETELGGELVHRDGRHTELSELGQTLRGHFAEIDRTRNLVRTTAKAVTSGKVSDLNIGLMCTIGPRLLAKMLDSFLQQNPGVSIVLHDITPKAASALLISGALDGVFCGNHDVSNSQLRYIDLFEEALVVAFPSGHPFSKKDAIPLREIAKHRYVERLHCEFREEVLNVYKEQDLQPYL